ncbi:aminoglycoside phosphotransferase family protein [Bacillus sp. SM2101]|uniref:aminoglycoside phosphotransferase family protein n=1 Tax=Bacillus sp. SM2101 TaxID=2805366 RepID=UPI001BDF0AA8|nr:aminoglycoside phosphotransferase family protein [Bacillus sp. SM2101]
MGSIRLSSRYFNEVRYNPERNTVTKLSQDSAKLINELYWYIKLPRSLQHYTPEIINYSEHQLNTFIEMEYINAPTLSELFVNSETPIREWEEYILPKINVILKEFSQHKSAVNSMDLSQMYITKTINRLKQFIQTNSIAFGIYKRGYLKLNGTLMKCPLRFLEENSNLLTYVINQAKSSVIHGDLCFSNMFFDLKRKEIKIIDPRGSFGQVGIYGDLHYDMAKLQHSLTGYDHIISDNFQINIQGIELDYRINQTQYHKKITDIWKGSYYNQTCINLIEALLFLSMIPLHKGDFKRQLAMYSLGVELLQKNDTGRRTT